MTRMPVTVADQGLALWPEDVDELVDLLTDAAAVIGALAGAPAAEAALAEAGAAGLDSCTDLAIDLRLAAARLDEETTACQINDHVTKGPGNTRIRSRTSRDTPQKTNTPKNAPGKVNE
jgi:hypothetical protein